MKPSFKDLDSFVKEKPKKNIIQADKTKDNKEKTQHTLYLSPEAAKKLRLAYAIEMKSMSEIVENLILNHIQIKL